MQSQIILLQSKRYNYWVEADKTNYIFSVSYCYNGISYVSTYRSQNFSYCHKLLEAISPPAKSLFPMMLVKLGKEHF